MIHQAPPIGTHPPERHCRRQLPGTCLHAQWLVGGHPGDLAAQNRPTSRPSFALGNLGDAIDASYWYGPYPYDRVGYVLTTDGALEDPDQRRLSAIHDHPDPRATIAVYLHELGHHWWGTR